MAKYQIPEPFQPGFEHILKLNDKQVKEISNTLKKLPVGTGPKTFQNIIIKSLKVEGSVFIARTLFSLGGLLVTDGASLSELANDITDALNITRKTVLTDKEKDKLIKNLVEIFNNCNNLKNTFKAIDLLSENGQIFKEARIITDVRLVFNDDISSQNRNAVVLHQLKMEYLQNDIIKDFFISLDNTDLIKLRSQVDRAIEKEAQIRNSYNNNITFIKIDD